jgi:type IV secretion system protein VirB6/type IV secretion system protein TrbL
MARAAGTAGRIAADTGANLVKGSAVVARNKAGSIADAARERIANTTGGKIAAAIRGDASAAPIDAMGKPADASPPEPAPQFEGNTISAGEAEDEIAAFRDRQQGEEPTT